MRPSLGLLLFALLCGSACACGSSGGVTDTASRTATSVNHKLGPDVDPAAPYYKVDADKDNDIGAADDDTNNNRALDFGHAASATDARAITALIKRYYAIALAGEGAKACTMIYSTLAEAIPEDYGEVGGPPYMKGIKTCAAGMTALFRHYHAQLGVEVPKLTVNRVRLIERHGYAILGFGGLPEREMTISREGHSWRIGAILDTELP